MPGRLIVGCDDPGLFRFAIEVLLLARSLVESIFTVFDCKHVVGV
jgi:hypothetical protein